jgi:branched-chain amino acid transport system ATP-binding protein
MTTASMLEVTDLSIRYGGVTALEDVSLRVREGAVAGLIGPNGAGKTSFIDAVSGFTPVDQGHIRFAGKPLDPLPPHRRARRGLARTFQSLELFDDLTVRDNLSVFAHTPTWRETCTDVLWPKRHATPEVGRWLGVIGLDDHADDLPSTLSNGQRHLVAIGRALAGQPKLLLLDEPAAGLDPAETAALGSTIRRIRDQGITVLLVDHDMGLVLDVCDTVHVLDHGSLIASGTPAEIRSDASVIEAYLGHQGAAS